MTWVGQCIKRAKALPARPDAPIIADVGRSKDSPKPSALAELLPMLLEISTPAGPRIRLEIPGEGTAGTEAFEGESYEEVCRRLIKAHVHGTRLIRKQSRELKSMRLFVSDIKSLVVHLAKLPNNLSAEAQDVLKELATAIERQQ